MFIRNILNFCSIDFNSNHKKHYMDKKKYYNLSKFCDRHPENVLMVVDGRRGANEILAFDSNNIYKIYVGCACRREKDESRRYPIWIAPLETVSVSILATFARRSDNQRVLNEMEIQQNLKDFQSTCLNLFPQLPRALAAKFNL